MLLNQLVFNNIVSNLSLTYDIRKDNINIIFGYTSIISTLETEKEVRASNKGIIKTKGIKFLAQTLISNLYIFATQYRRP